jgi:hypothetical protein
LKLAFLLFFLKFVGESWDGSPRTEEMFSQVCDVLKKDSQEEKRKGHGTTGLRWGRNQVMGQPLA